MASVSCKFVTYMKTQKPVSARSVHVVLYSFIITNDAHCDLKSDTVMLKVFSCHDPILLLYLCLSVYS